MAPNQGLQGPLEVDEARTDSEIKQEYLSREQVREWWAFASIARHWKIIIGNGIGFLEIEVAGYGSVLIYLFIINALKIKYPK